MVIELDIPCSWLNDGQKNKRKGEQRRREWGKGENRVRNEEENKSKRVNIFSSVYF